MTENLKIKQLIDDNQVLLFMKGNPKFPQCGFSSLACQVLDACGTKYETFDVLQDPDVREGIKIFSNWPTIPQLYVKESLLEDPISSKKCMSLASLLN